MAEPIADFIAMCEGLGCYFRPVKGALHVEVKNTRGKLGESHLDAGLRAEINRREPEILEFISWIDDPEQA